VGGSVRDSFLNKPPKDIDIVVEGLSLSELKTILLEFGKVSIVGESFSVIKFKPIGWKDDIDIAMPRYDKKIGAGHKGIEAISNKDITINQDLKRRDLTINSFCVNVKTGNILDPFNGLSDLHNKILKATDSNAFIEDPLRILRTIKFAARLGFDIDDGTKKIMKKHAHLIKEIPGERILNELQNILDNAGNTQIALNLIHETDLDVTLFDKKMLKYDKGFDKLDSLSFYYVLALVGDVDPEKFYTQRLKGLGNMGKALKTLDSLLSSWNDINEEVDKRFVVFKAVQKAPEILKAIIVPPDLDKIMDLMKSGELLDCLCRAI
jgi:tRNA nucleotidyltransferase/poly(A) polymerase